MPAASALSGAAGPALALRLIRREDAAYIHGLRTNPAYSQHLSEVRGTATDQARWIDTYKLREAAGHEYYYIIERHDGMRCGTVRLYAITAEGFTWGSWILDHNKPPKAALESAVLSFGIGFALTTAPQAVVEVRQDNSHARAFYNRLGMEETGQDGNDVFLRYSREAFMRDRAQYLDILKGAAV